MRNAPGTPRPAADRTTSGPTSWVCADPFALSSCNSQVQRCGRRSEKFEAALEDGVTEFGLDLG